MFRSAEHVILVLIAVTVHGTVKSQEWYFKGVNVAEGKDTSQGPGTYKTYYSRLAVDGNSDTDFGDGSCSHTGGKYNTKAYWTVNISIPYILKGIRIYNRGGYQKRRHKNFKVIGNQPRTILHDDETAVEKLYNRLVIDIPVYSNNSFNEVTVEVPAHTGSQDGGKSFLQLCEVQIFSELRCDSPANITNGEYLQLLDNTYSIGTTLIWSCLVGYESEQNQTRVCMANTSWSDEEPRCSLIECPFPVNISNGSLVLANGTELHSGHIPNRETVKVVCDKGFKSNASNITCTLEGQWDDIPMCSQIQCQSLGNLTVGYYMYNGTTDQINGDMGDMFVYGTVATAVCNETLFRSNEVILICGTDGTWTGNESFCVALCKEPVLDNGHYLGQNNNTMSEYEAGHSVMPVCDEGYQLDGHINETTDVLLTCLANHTWDGRRIPCAIVECSTDSLRTNENFYQLDQSLAVSVEFNETISGKCIDGYERKSGDKDRICLSNKTFSGEELICTVALCKEPVLDNGHYLGQNNNTMSEYEAGHSVMPVCDEGYQLDGHINETTDVLLTCLANHTWDGRRIPCAIVECSTDSLRTNENFYQLDQSLAVSVEFNETISGKCIDGYERKSGDKDRICLSNKTFSGEELICTVMECSTDSLRTDENFYQLDHSLTFSVEFNETISGKCIEGYEHKSGDMYRICLSNKTFSGDELVCAEIPQEGAAAKSSSVPAAAGGSVAVVALLAAVGIVAFVMYRRRRKKSGESDPAQTTVYDNLQDSKVAYSNDVYQNCNGTQENEVEKEPYYDFTTIHRMSETAIKVSDLAAVVLVSDSKSERFTKEFQGFPEGMVMPHEKAIENKIRNRYRNLYAYDDTRVVLDIWDEETDTDYINACYIHGFKEPRAYIASQGPVTDILNDFWRMIWQTHCGKIVMLTNLREEGKMKCNQYWPKEITHMYGSIKVTLVDTETFSNFVIRTLLIEKAGEQQRTVLHFHFTSWPDKDVPFFCSSLVHFRHKVKTAASSCSGPIVVHCSAGIGRTGTFIAIDYLIDQSQELGYLDVAMCVASLRRQRVNMVQTKKQYVFVHQALVEILVLKTSIVPTSGFEKSYRELLSVNPAKKRRKIDLEFEMLWGLSPKTEEDKKVETRDDHHKDKSRYSNIHPVKEHMPSLSQPGLQLFGEFINATFLPTYKESNALIITQSPLGSTKEDFWKMVYHQNVHTIVMMNDVSELKVNEIYWPEKETSITHEDLVILKNGVAKQSGHTIVKLTLDQKGKERQVQLIQFGGWKEDKPLPEPESILSALDLVEDNQRHTENTPIVVHCMDGVEKSGLFCVIVSLLERTKIEQDVAISQVIEEMRNRRENIIPNVEQFEFLHEVALAFLRQYETYSNFAI